MRRFYSDCCGCEMDGEDITLAICPGCNENCGIIADCEACGGAGEVIDEKKIRPWTIDVPYCQCPECKGKKIVEYATC